MLGETLYKNDLTSPDVRRYFFISSGQPESETLALSIARAIRYLEMQLIYDGRMRR